jgi:hypothetical protein
MMRSGLASLAALLAAVVTTGDAVKASLLTPAQQSTDRAVLALREEPVVKAARDDLERRWQALRPASTPDGRAQLSAAVDEAVIIALRSASADPASPQVIWSEAPPYTSAGRSVPGGRSGDSPDRIYRFAALSPQYSYVIHGRRNAAPSLPEFSFEALEAPAIFGKALSHLSSEDIDIAADGSFTVTVDATPANGRRNHLYLPPQSTNILIRDTVTDWGAQHPNDVRIERVDGANARPRSKAEIIEEARRAIIAVGEINTPFLQLIWDAPANALKPRLRPLAWGLPGSGIALGRFSVKPDEAAVITLDALGGQYLGFVLGDPWMRSVNYWDHTGSLNNVQAKPNADGSYTFVISAKDPGVFNWLNPGGLQDGAMAVRWEGLPADAPIENGFRGARVVKLTDLASALPDGIARATPEDRAQQLAARKAGFQLRIAQR